MTEEDAKGEIAEMVAAGAAPTLTDDQIASLLPYAQRHDGDGRAPADDGWEPTYNLHAAAAEGLRRKAAQVAPDYDFVIEDEGSDQSQVHRHLMQEQGVQRALAAEEDRTTHAINAWANGLAAANATADE